MTKSRGSKIKDMSGPDQEKTEHARMTGWMAGASNMVDALLV